MWREFDKKSSICFLAISFISSLLNKTASSPSGWSHEQGNQAKRAKEKSKKLRGSLAILLPPVLPNLDSTDWRGAARSLPLNLFSWWCIDIAGRKLMLVTLGTKRVKLSVVTDILNSLLPIFKHYHQHVYSPHYYTHCGSDKNWIIFV